MKAGRVARALAREAKEKEVVQRAGQDTNKHGKAAENQVLLPSTQ